MHTVLQNIKTLRKLKGFSQEYMAEQLGHTQSSYARFENHTRKIDYLLVEKIADLFGMPVADVINFNRKENDRYNLSFEPTVIQEDREVYQTRDMRVLEEKIQHLETVITMMEQQLSDKDEIIGLLKEQTNDQS